MTQSISLKGRLNHFSLEFKHTFTYTWVNVHYNLQYLMTIPRSDVSYSQLSITIYNIPTVIPADFYFNNSFEVKSRVKTAK